MDWTTPPVVRTRTAESTGYVIETLNFANVGPGGCVRMTTRECWRLSATALSGGDITPQVDNQKQPECPSVLTEQRMSFGINEPQPVLRKCGYCKPPTAGPFSMRFKPSSSSDHIKLETTTKKSKTVLNEDVACETSRTVLIHAESQTDFATIETDCNPGISGSETAISDSSNNCITTSSRPTLRDCTNKNNSESSNDERDRSQNVSSEDDITYQIDICPKCKAINSKKKCNVISQTDLRRKKSSHRECRVCRGKEENKKRSKASKSKKKSH